MNWDYLIAHPNVDLGISDDAMVLEFFRRMHVNPNDLIRGTPMEQVMIMYDKHPTHWLMFMIFSGHDDPAKNGYGGVALSKKMHTMLDARKKFYGSMIASGGTIRGGTAREFPDPLPQ